MPNSPRKKPNIIETDLDNELVLLNPITQAIFTLNATGRVVWQHLGVLDVPGIADTLVARFRVPTETALGDTQDLIVALHAADLLESE